MTSTYATKLENNQLIIERDDGLATLRIIHRPSQAYIDNLDDNTLNPLVELANDIQGSLDNSRLTLTLIGTDNVITFSDDDAPILEGGVYLNNVQLNNPYLKNCKLVDVDLKHTKNLTMHYCKVDGFFMETEERIHLVCCYINDRYGLENTRFPLQFLMNKHVGQ